MLIACVSGLSVHIILLQDLHVPYPVGYPDRGVPLFLNLLCQSYALFSFYHLVSDQFVNCRWKLRTLILFLLSSGLHEAIVRLPLMNAICSTAWRYSFVAGIPRWLTSLFLALAVVRIAPLLTSNLQRLGGAFAVAGFVQAVCLPPLNLIFRWILSSIASLAHPDVFVAPYDWHVEVPAYITYLEPVLACFFLVLLVWDRLPGSFLSRLSRFVLLVLAINTTLVRPFLFVFYTKLSPWIAMLSEGQFFLEALVLAAATATYWSSSQEQHQQDDWHRK